MLDPGKQYEIFANGHPNFLTSACRKKVLEASLHSADAFNTFEDTSVTALQMRNRFGDDDDDAMHTTITEQELLEVRQASNMDSNTSARERAMLRRRINANPESRGARLLGSSCRLPEPVSEFAEGARGRDKIVTLRVRALPGKTLPEFFEGDRIIGRYRVLGRGMRGKRRGSKRKRTGKKKKRRKSGSDDDKDSDSDDDDDDDDEVSEDSDDDGYDDDDISDDESTDDDDDGSPSKNRKRKRRRRYRTKIFRILSIHWGLVSYVNLLLQGSSARRGGGNDRSSSDKNCFAVCEVLH